MWGRSTRRAVPAVVVCAGPDCSGIRGGALLPPYETVETLDRLTRDLSETGAKTVICLGDSFDDLAAGAFDRIRERARAMVAASVCWPSPWGGKSALMSKSDDRSMTHCASPAVSCRNKTSPN